MGWDSFTFQWLVEPDKAIYTVVIAGVWQVAGFVASAVSGGPARIDTEILKAAWIDGAPLWKTYTRIIIPAAPGLSDRAGDRGASGDQSYDLVVALTKGGPGISTERPAVDLHVFHHLHPQRHRPGAASAVVMLMALAAVIVPSIRAR